MTPKLMLAAIIRWFRRPTQSAISAPTSTPAFVEAEEARRQACRGLARGFRRREDDPDRVKDLDECMRPLFTKDADGVCWAPRTDEPAVVQALESTASQLEQIAKRIVLGLREGAEYLRRPDLKQDLEDSRACLSEELVCFHATASMLLSYLAYADAEDFPDLRTEERRAELAVEALIAGIVASALSTYDRTVWYREPQREGHLHELMRLTDKLRALLGYSRPGAMNVHGASRTKVGRTR